MERNGRTRIRCYCWVYISKSGRGRKKSFYSIFQMFQTINRNCVIVAAAEAANRAWLARKTSSFLTFYKRYPFIGHMHRALTFARFIASWRRENSSKSKWSNKQPSTIIIIIYHNNIHQECTEDWGLTNSVTCFLCSVIPTVCPSYSVQASVCIKSGSYFLLINISFNNLCDEL